MIRKLINKMSILELQQAVNLNREQQHERQQSLDRVQLENETLQSQASEVLFQLKEKQLQQIKITKDIPPLKSICRKQAHQINQLLSELIHASSKLEHAKKVRVDRKQQNDQLKKQFVTEILLLENRSKELDQNNNKSKETMVQGQNEIVRLRASKEKIAEALEKRCSKLISVKNTIDSFVVELENVHVQLISNKKDEKRVTALIELAIENRKNAEHDYYGLVQYYVTEVRRGKQLKVDINAAVRTKKRQISREKNKTNTNDEIESDDSDDFCSD